MKTGESKTPSFTILYDTIRWEEKAILRAAEKTGVGVNLVDSKNLNISLNTGSSQINDRVILQRCVSYFRNVHSTAALEYAGHVVVNKFSSAWMCGNKLFCTIQLVKNKIPTPRTRLAFTEDAALKAIEGVGYPAVLKPVVGSWGRLSALIKDADAAVAILEGREYMFPLYQVYYLQEFVRRPPRDIRSFVIGDSVVAAIYRISQFGDWRTNTGRGGRAENCPIGAELEELSLRAANATGAEIAGIDLMETKDGLVVHEVNNTTEFKNTVPATGVDIPSMIVDYLVAVERR